MKKIIKNSIKIYIGFVIGIFISILMINADNSLNASSISIDKTNMQGISGTTLNSALDYLYERASHIGECPSGQICEIDFGGMFVYETATKTYEHIVYMDPTDLSRTCYDLNSDSTTGQKTGCMKWYIYGRDNDGNYLAILDHNTAERQAWNINGQYGTNVAYEDSLVYSVVQNLVSESNWNSILKPRLISAYEVADIVGNNEFTGQTIGFYLDGSAKSDQEKSNYAWLYDNLGWNDGMCTKYGCNVCDTINSGAYWTSTPYGDTGLGTNVYRINRDGSFGNGAAYNNYHGVRPVITIPKNIKRHVSMMYLNPQDLSYACDEFNIDSTTGNKDGCMKWYIYEETGDKYYAILDHNTTAGQAWNTDTNVTQYGTNVAFGPNTTGDSTKNNLAYIELMKLVSDYNWVLTPDLISAEEVASIVDYVGFNATNNDWFYLDSKNQNTYPNYQGGSDYAWLFDNLGWTDWTCTNYGCNYTNTTNSSAYWTKTVYGTVGTGSDVWIVSRSDRLTHYYAYNSYHGVRPVIKVDKTIFN